MKAKTANFSGFGISGMVGQTPIDSMREGKIRPSTPGGEVYLKLTVINAVQIVSFKEL